MSASLVGSEMCIRDSSRAWSPMAAAARGSASRSPDTGSRHPGPRCPSGCLLYTSDAADDM
eukprot:11871694-Alexandrium_andersonii.AAC.1